MKPPRVQRYALTVLVLLGLLIGSALAVNARPRGQALGIVAAATATPTRAAAPTSVLFPTAEPTVSSPTATTAAPTPTIASTATATLTAVPTELGPCGHYQQIAPDLLTYVDHEVGLPRDFEPPDLEIVPLETANTAYRPIRLRAVVHQPLLDLLDAMNEAGLSVWVMSGYRSYSEQTLAYEKWEQLYPDRAAEISALPGHSEHQLGTAVDFSARYMVDLYGDFFNVRFAQTAEGQWLREQAADYGFTLSYPSWGVEQTGYAWEPWHYRYVGSLALELNARDLTLTQYLQECAPPASQ